MRVVAAPDGSTDDVASETVVVVACAAQQSDSAAPWLVPTTAAPAPTTAAIAITAGGILNSFVFKDGVTVVICEEDEAKKFGQPCYLSVPNRDCTVKGWVSKPH